jgi:phage replication O-like protein O
MMERESMPKERFPGFLKPNYTQVPDVILDELMAKLSGAELKVLLYIVRRTFGFQKDVDIISIPQLMDGITKKDGEKLDYGTGLSRDAVVRAIKSLEEQNIIIRERRTDEHNADRPSTFRLNIIQGESKNKTHSGRKIVPSPVRLSDPQETGKSRNR